MKEHPGHFWICFWLFLVVWFGTIDDHTGKTLDRIADTLARIETKLDTARERLP